MAAKELCVLKHLKQDEARCKYDLEVDDKESSKQAIDPFPA
jgi:hypothetical protein